MKALQAGLELEMPSTGGLGDAQIVKAVQNGELAEEILDLAVERLLTFVIKAVESRKENASFNVEDHHRLAREVARESMVLLRNEDGILPLSKQGTIAVIGEFAKNPRYQGGGSSHVNPTKLDDAFEEMKAHAGSAELLYAQGYELNHDTINEALL